MKWKFPVFFGGLVMALAATAVSCSDDATAPARVTANDRDARISQQKVQDLQDKYGWMGRYHTQALDFIYNRLVQSKAVSKTEKCRVATKALKDFDKTFSKDDGSKGLRDDFLPADICEGSSDFSASQQVQLDVNPERLKPNSDISTQATSLMYQIQGVFDTDASLAASKSAIYRLDAVAASTLNTAEAGAVIGIGSIAISSADYWNANLGLWQSGGSTRPAAYNRLSTAPGIASVIVGSSPTVPRYGLSPLGKRILKADVSTAITSVLSGWWMGAADLEAACIRAAAASAVAGMFKT